MKVEELHELNLYAIIRDLRREGVRVSPAEVIDFIRIARMYNLLVHGREGFPPIEELINIAKSVFARNAREEVIVEKVFRRIRSRQKLAQTLAAVEDDLRRLRLSWGSRIASKRKLLSGYNAEEKREAYSRLRLLGLIVRTSRGEFVVDKETAIRRLRSILERYSSPWEALADSAARMISRGRFEWFTLYAAPVDEERLGNVEIDRIALAGLQALSEGNRGLARKLANLVLKRLEAGEVPRDSIPPYKLLAKLGMLSAKSLASLLRGEPRLVDQLLRSREARDMLAEALRLLDTKSLKPILKRLVKDKRGLDVALSLIGEVELSAWSEVNVSRQPRDWREALIAATALLAKVEQHLLQALQGDEAQLNYALFELQKLERMDLTEAPRHLRQFILDYRERVQKLLDVVEGDAEALAKLEVIVKKLPPDEALLYLKQVYTHGDERAKMFALRLAEIVWRRLEAKTGVLKGRYREVNSFRGRLDVRKTLFNLIALREHPLVFRGRLRRPQYSLVLDVSGSMAKYSLWALLAASCFAACIDTLTFFSSNVTIVRDAWRLTRRKLIELLFTQNFQGYTNISAALREVAHNAAKPGHMIVVTDLCQTVIDEKPSEVVARLYNVGWRFTFILPPRHCSCEKSTLSNYASLHVVTKPEQIPRIVARIVGVKR